MFLYLVKGSVYVDKTEHIDAQAQYIDGNHGYESFDHIQLDLGHLEQA